MSKKKGVTLQVYKKKYVWKEYSMFEFLVEVGENTPSQTITNNDVENPPPTSDYDHEQFEYVQLACGDVACVVVSSATWSNNETFEVLSPKFFIGVPFDENKRKELLAKLSDYEKALLGVTS